ncbi:MULTISPECIES: TetR family transcriptional regulator C-terminal domain-containing protein [unclassified Streptomyces]|uniref:TetR/AcrR family transcriptional regulator n=1 Tax=unclassified Streptomyces TaxID=2593676 RepID=UPI0036E04082
MARQSMREEIVAAAADRFHTHGYNAAGVKDITDAAGVPKGSFYNHFPSKEALAVTILELYGATRRLKELSDPSVEPLTRLRRHFEFLRAEQKQYGYTRGCLLGNFGAEVADHSTELRERVGDSFDRWSRALAGALRDAVTSGAVDPALDPDETALFLLSAWEGALLVARGGRSGKPFDVFFGMVFDRILVPGRQQRD